MVNHYHCSKSLPECHNKRILDRKYWNYQHANNVKDTPFPVCTCKKFLRLNFYGQLCVFNVVISIEITLCHTCQCVRISLVPNVSLRARHGCAWEKKFWEVGDPDGCKMPFLGLFLAGLNKKKEAEFGPWWVKSTSKVNILMYQTLLSNHIIRFWSESLSKWFHVSSRTAKTLHCTGC